MQHQFQGQQGAPVVPAPGGVGNQQVPGPLVPGAPASVTSAESPYSTPAFILSGVNTALILGSAYYFYNQNAQLREDMKKVTDLVKEMGEKMVQITKNDDNRKRLIDEFNNNLLEITESLEKDRSQSEEKFEALIEGMRKGNLDVDIPSRKPERTVRFDAKISRSKSTSSAAPSEEEDDIIKGMRRSKGNAV